MTEMYHQGEIAVQELAGERDRAVLNGRVIAGVIPAAARPFVGQQSCVAIGWHDSSGDPWASLLVGDPGLAVCSDDGSQVTLQVQQEDLREGSPVGLLIIDLVTRRRLRVNGVVDRLSPSTVHIAVEEAFPNCPKYIQKREFQREGLAESSPVTAPASATGPGAPPGLQAWLARTDTAFVTSLGPGGRLDCSHRGGRRGFITFDGEAIRIPDYPGNSMYCSLGNMAVDPRAGLVLVDFEARQQLQLSGHVRLAITPTERSWTLTPQTWAMMPLAGPAHWRLIEESRFNPELTIQS